MFAWYLLITTSGEKSDRIKEYEKNCVNFVTANADQIGIKKFGIIMQEIGNSHK